MTLTVSSSSNTFLEREGTFRIRGRKARPNSSTFWRAGAAGVWKGTPLTGGFSGVWSIDSSVTTDTWGSLSVTGSKSLSSKIIGSCSGLSSCFGFGFCGVSTVPICRANQILSAIFSSLSSRPSKIPVRASRSIKRLMVCSKLELLIF